MEFFANLFSTPDERRRRAQRKRYRELAQYDERRREAKLQEWKDAYCLMEKLIRSGSDDELLVLSLGQLDVMWSADLHFSRYGRSDNFERPTIFHQLAHRQYSALRSRTHAQCARDRDNTLRDLSTMFQKARDERDRFCDRWKTILTPTVRQMDHATFQIAADELLASSSGLDHRLVAEEVRALMERRDATVRRQQSLLALVESIRVDYSSGLTALEHELQDRLTKRASALTSDFPSLHTNMSGGHYHWHIPEFRQRDIPAFHSNYRKKLRTLISEAAKALASLHAEIQKRWSPEPARITDVLKRL